MGGERRTFAAFVGFEVASISSYRRGPCGNREPTERIKNWMAERRNHSREVLLSRGEEIKLVGIRGGKDRAKRYKQHITHLLTETIPFCSFKLE